jgi:tRNA dimethylallyltransferase
VIKVFAIAGPTASGKSKLSMDLARDFPLEIISADSMQVYKYMDIGTDKPTQEDRRKVQHHLIDVKYPDEQWNVEEFQRSATEAIYDITKRGAIPCIVGGTGFYLRALLRAFPLVDAPPNWEFRQDMESLAREKGKETVHNLLKDIDPFSWETIHPNDLKRVIRALEYFEATKRPISHRRLISEKSPYDDTIIALSWPREELYQRINDRVEIQFREGFVEEVKALLERGYSEQLSSMQGLGYFEICQYLKGLLTLEETKELIKRNTRRFAKRQLTWFSKEEGIIWIEAGNHKPWNEIVREAHCILETKWSAN